VLFPEPATIRSTSKRAQRMVIIIYYRKLITVENMIGDCYSRALSSECAAVAPRGEKSTSERAVQQSCRRGYSGMVEGAARVEKKHRR